MSKKSQASHSFHSRRQRPGALSVLLTAALVVSVPACVASISADENHHPGKTSHQESAMNMFGGASYQGEPALAVTAALVKAGGGSEHFSFAQALVTMLGQDTVQAEVAKLTDQYGAAEVKTFLGGMDLAVALSLKHATQAGVVLPPAAELTGIELAKTLVSAGTTPDGTFWSGHLFDKAVSNEIHHQVMVDINQTAGYEADLITHKILNQAMYDVAQALGMTTVKLASLH